MNDRNGKPVTVGARCLFRSPTGRTWLPGTVRAVNHGEARADNGAPDNDDLASNGFTASAWVTSSSIDIVSS